jgi:DNA-directed RNA polymerase subunit beta'
VDTFLVVEDGDEVYEGDELARIPQEVVKTKDITGGLPRVVELFEARRPKNAAIISEIEGVVSLEPTPKGLLKVVVTSPTGRKKEYSIPQGKHLLVYENDRVGVGEPLTDGPINPHDVLRLEKARLREHLVNEIQEVYRLQGVTVNDKHIEIIVRQMLSFVQVTESGDSRFLTGEIVKKEVLERENKKLRKKRKKEATFQPVLLGVTRASLYSDSFISAASFQETTRVLTESAMRGECDFLKGLKENVVIGHLIPAGTGLKKYQKLLPQEKVEKV